MTTQSIPTRMRALDSSHIASTARVGSTMFIRFTDGSVYQYEGSEVTRLHRGLRRSRSVGKYFAKRVKTCTKLNTTRRRDLEGGKERASA